ncbi:DnaB-like helicase C-terminal domain-containing protein [Bdellovibrionota bacterium FG-2]
MSNQFDLKSFLDNEIYPCLDRRVVVQELQPVDHGEYLKMKCPSCGRGEAFIYKTGFHIQCSHKGSCGYKASILAFLAGGTTPPKGEVFKRAFTKLVELAGKPQPSWADTTHYEELRGTEARRSMLDVVAQYCETALWSEKGELARRYLNSERGLTDDQIKNLELGLYYSATECETALKAVGFNESDYHDVGAVWPKLENFITFPWKDDRGRLLTIYVRYPQKKPPLMNDHPAWTKKRNEVRTAWEALPEDSKSKQPWAEPTISKTMALPGQGSKSTPLYMDRALSAGFRDLVLVEGVLDAALLQALGEKNVIACVAAQLSKAQVATLVQRQIKSVTICLDPDPAGKAGILSCLRSLDQEGITAYVAPTLPDELDPDEFVIKFGVEAWREHIKKAVHGFRYIAQKIILKHKSGDSWADPALEALMCETIAFDAKGRTEARRTELETYFWPEIFDHTPLTSAKIEERRAGVRKSEEEKAKEEKIARVGSAIKSVEITLASRGPDAAAKELIMTARSLSDPHRDTKPEAFNVADTLEPHENRICKYRGAEFIGLPQRTLPGLDQATYGLRNLMLIAAPPNVGKTALATQFGLDIILYNPDACFVFVSLEMTQWDIMARLLCKLAGIDWRTFIFGSRKGMEPGRSAYFSKNELDRITKAECKLMDIGRRLVIMDARRFPEPNVETIMEQVDALKKRSGARRAYVLVDYLQVWPVPHDQLRDAHSEIEVDKMRIDGMKRLRDAMDGDPVLVISEARKPSEKDGAWGGNLADVMGSARASYTPDIVFLLQPFSDTRILQHAENTSPETPADFERAKRIRREYADAGFSLNSLHIAKGRDGVERKSFDLRFSFKESRFEEEPTRD